MPSLWYNNFNAKNQSRESQYGWRIVGNRLALHYRVSRSNFRRGSEGDPPLAVLPRNLFRWFIKVLVYVSRAGEKLEHALKSFDISVIGLVCADFGSSTGGFVDCLLQSGAEKVYAVETGYGVLDYKLRQDKRVVVMERENAMHVELPEKVDFITLDTSWTKLDKVLPNAFKNLKDGSQIVALVKPHYEADPKMLRKGKLLEEFIPEVLERVKAKLQELGIKILAEVESPILGEKGKNKEYLFHLSLI